MDLEFTQTEWDALIERFPPGTTVSGTVSDQQLYGVWVAVDELPHVPALLEVIHFSAIESDQEKIGFPDDYPEKESRITARILGWCTKPKDVRLTQLSHLDPSHKRHQLRQRRDPT